jgi:hypothetical protein
MKPCSQWCSPGMLTRGALQQGRTFFWWPPPPPSPKKFRSVYHFRGPKIFRTYQNFLRIDTNFSKFAEFVPFFFIIIQYCRTVKRILLNVFGILFFVCRQIPSFTDNSFSVGCHTPHTPPIATALTGGVTPSPTHTTQVDHVPVLQKCPELAGVFTIWYFGNSKFCWVFL